MSSLSIRRALHRLGEILPTSLSDPRPAGEVQQGNLVLTKILNDGSRFQSAQDFAFQ